MNKLIEPCKNYVKDKTNISLSDIDAKKYISTAINTLQLNNNKTLSKTQQKQILTSVLELVNKENSLEYVLDNLENERMAPVTDIPLDFDDNLTQPTQSIQSIQPIQSIQQYKTVLIQSTKVDFNYQFDNFVKIAPHKLFIKSSKPIILLWIDNNLYHFYKKRTEDYIYHTCNENLITNNNFHIKFENIPNCSLYTIKNFKQVDDNHYQIILTNINIEQSDIKIYYNDTIYTFYYVTDDLYISDDFNLSYFNINNAKALLTTNMIYLICKLITT